VTNVQIEPMLSLPSSLQDDPVPSLTVAD